MYNYAIIYFVYRGQQTKCADVTINVGLLLCATSISKDIVTLTI